MTFNHFFTKNLHFQKTAVVFTFIVLLSYFILQGSRLTADDYCNAYATHKLGWFGASINSYTNWSPFPSTNAITYLNFAITNQLPPLMSSSLILIILLSLFFFLSKTLINFFNPNFRNLIITMSILLYLLLSLIISGYGTNAGGILYHFSWVTASIAHLLPGVLITLYVLFFLNIFFNDKPIKNINLKFLFLIILNLLIINFSFLEGLIFIFILMMLIIHNYLSINNIKFYTFLILSLVFSALNIFINYRSPGSNSRSGTLNLSNDASLGLILDNFINNYINYFFILFNSYSNFIAILLSLLILLLIPNFVVTKQKKLFLLIIYISLIFFISLLISTLTSILVYSAKWHLFAANFFLKFLIFLICLLCISKFKEVASKRYHYLIAAILTTFVSLPLYLAISGAQERTTLWSKNLPAAYDQIGDVESGWIADCNSKILDLPINKRFQNSG